MKTTSYFDLKNRIADAVVMADSLGLDFVKYILMMAELEMRYAVKKLAFQLDEAVQELPPSEHRFIPPLPSDPMVNVIGGWRWNAKSDHLSVDAAVAALLNIAASIQDTTASLAKLISLVHPEDRQRLNGAVRRAMMEGDVLCVAFRTTEPSGKFRWLLAVGRAAFDQNIDLVGLSGTIINLTEEDRTG